MTFINPTPALKKNKDAQEMITVDVAGKVIYVDGKAIDIKEMCLVHEQDIEKKATLVLSSQDPFWMGVILGKISSCLSEQRSLNSDTQSFTLEEKGKRLLQYSIFLQKDYVDQISREELILTHNALAANNVELLYSTLTLASAYNNLYMTGFIASRIASQLHLN